jgi:spore coat polysaccharide biosynthesis protein SpsF (cytidylyltransferase family)
MPAPRPIFRLLFSPEALLPSVVSEDVDDGDAPVVVDAGAVEVVDAVVEVSVVEAGADVIGVEDAPMGVNKELVTIAVLTVTEEPTRSAYGGKKS